MKKWRTLALLSSVLLLTTGCQSKESSSESTESNKVSISSKSSESSKKDSNNSEIEDIPASEFKQRVKTLKNAMIFFGDPTDKDYDQSLKKFESTAKKVSANTYKVNTSTEEGKKLVEERHMDKPYDWGVTLGGNFKGHYIVYNVKTSQIPPERIIKEAMAGIGGEVVNK
ncbi:hypothetical protein [Xylocopilactobacillus apis]|uniref:Lipoprotein n=1 Tax=Xylocopilactobacillus apis TaxID=2932183 RepID=A0AAU9D3C0_9LACO|nr:hypothetical protein [Xylocopilactobacillus apis]BDR57026.1 hypothetical protein KIMC2_15880 [Xylocopilactobacillus apis]